MRIFKRFHKGRKFPPAVAMAGAGTLCGDGGNSNAPEVAALAGMLLSWHPPPKLQDGVITLDLYGDGGVVP